MSTEILTALFFIICIISTIHAADEEITIDCKIGKVNYIFFNQLLSCTVYSKPNIVKRETKVTSICSGSTTGIRVFYALSKIIRYIPKNLDQVFPDLTGFRLENTQLKMVTKEDLQPFPELTMFASVSNHIEFLDEDLFMYNEKLQYVSFRANKISFIHPDVFNVVRGSLKQLYMDAQAINCGIGNPTTVTAIGNALDKLASSECTDIINAPALYTLWLELKGQVSGGGEDLQQCQTQLAEATAALTSASDNLLAVQTDLDSCTSNLEAITAQYDECMTNTTTVEDELAALETTLGEVSLTAANCCSAHPESCA
ncbi:uncharacterized protein [Chironomus tepperi]|uniref:uncharacterized protein n=1 Tax=Chironomus tepperi TaxID=113505 RepID=UPI00391F5073